MQASFRLESLAGWLPGYPAQSGLSTRASEDACGRLCPSRPNGPGTGNGRKHQKAHSNSSLERRAKVRPDRLEKDTQHFTEGLKKVGF